MAHTIPVTIYGQQLSVATEESREKVEAVAAKVDGLMRLIAARGVADTARVAVLASLHLADHLIRLEERVKDLESRVEAQSATLEEKKKAKPAQKERLSNLLSLLDQELEDTPARTQAPPAGTQTS
jgi:cell division protein ZapA (FtsZ GTPase activity inhibitor)